MRRLHSLTHEEDEGRGDADDAIESHGKVAGSAEDEEEFEDYRVIIESMQKSGQQWIMLSYCWGKRDAKTGQYDMQQTVIKVFRRLVKEHGLPVWLDIFGGMGGDVYESMGRGVRGAAVVVPFLSSAYDTSANGKRELKFACNLDKPLVPASTTTIPPGLACATLSQMAIKSEPSNEFADVRRLLVLWWISAC